MKAYVYNGFRVLVKVFGKKGFSEKLEILCFRSGLKFLKLCVLSRLLSRLTVLSSLR